MSREDVVPGVFGKIHESRRSPWVALIFAAVVVCGLLVLGTLLDEAGIGGDDGVVARLATVTVVFTLFIYALVIVSALKMRGHDEDEDTFLASTPLLWAGILGNLVLLVYVVVDDPASLLWCAGLLVLGALLFAAEYFFGNRDRGAGAERGIRASRTDAQEI
jgi:amino acid transporter